MREMKMKNLILVLIASFMTISNLFASGVPERVRNDLYCISYQIKSDIEFEEEYYRSVIPEEYAEAFLYYTRDFPEIRLNFYSIMVHESANFTAFRHVNKNGSVDLGPSQLNSSNLRNKRFVNAFRPKDESKITSVYCYYMVMTINYYHDLYKRHGDAYAFYAYNGGDKAVVAIKQNIQSPNMSSLVKNVRAYNRKVRKLVKQHKAEIIPFVEELRDQLVDMLCDVYVEKFGGSSRNVSIGFIVRKYIYEFINDRITYYIRRKNFSEFNPEEFIIILDPVIGCFYHEIRQIVVT